MSALVWRQKPTCRDPDLMYVRAADEAASCPQDHGWGTAAEQSYPQNAACLQHQHDWHRLRAAAAA